LPFAPAVDGSALFPVVGVTTTEDAGELRVSNPLPAADLSIDMILDNESRSCWLSSGSGLPGLHPCPSLQLPEQTIETAYPNAISRSLIDGEPVIEAFQ
jgi:hypothetical protein